MEKAAIPTVMLGYSDQQPLGRQLALIRGVPNIRWLDVPRTGSGDERVATFINQVVKALTDPLTAKEKETGLYNPPPDPRICFNGTLDDAQAFFQKTTPVANCRNCPMATWTDALPVIIPTEEKVKEMLTGTSHKAEEQIMLYSNNLTTGTITKGTSPVTFYPYSWAATVEKVAAIAVMAGCKPEYLPTVLAVASTGGQLPNSNGDWAGWICVSGPIAKEIGMNAGSGAMNGGNPANSTIGRSHQLMIANFGGAVNGSNRTDWGSPYNRAGMAFAEDDEALPKGWLTLREEFSYKTNQSALLLKWTPGSITSAQFAPSSFRGLVSEGYGGMARRMGVEGKPGPHNFLEYTMKELLEDRVGSKTFIMHPGMAQSLWDYGFKTKAAVFEWMWKATFIPVSQYRNYGWFDTSTNSGRNNEPTSGKPWNDLPPDYMVPTMGSTAASNLILVCMGPGDENTMQFQGGRGSRLYPIDPWK
jgi:hypothetical protein